MKNFDALVSALDLSAHVETFDPETAERLEAWRPAIAGSWLAGSQANPLALLQMLVIDDGRGESLDDAEFERITGLDSRFACHGVSLAGLDPDEVLQAVGRLALCVLASWRNQIREDVLDPAGLETEHEGAASAADVFVAGLARSGEATWLRPVARMAA